jgi:hypothetical protein
MAAGFTPAGFLFGGYEDRVPEWRVSIMGGLKAPGAPAALVMRSPQIEAAIFLGVHRLRLSVRV